jgi:mannose-1-phosphate guanylyltransferase
VLANRRFVAAERDFLILYADNLTTIDLGRMIRFHRTRTEPLTIGVAPTDAPSEKGTVIIGPNGQVTEFVEKAARPRSTLASAGIYVANRELFHYLPGTAASAEPLDFGHHVLPGLTPRMAAYHIDEFLADIGTPETYQRAQAGWPGLHPQRQRAAR